MFQLQAGGERGLGDLELLGGRLLGRQPVLQLVARLGERAREAVLRVADHPAEELGGDADSAELSRGSSGAAQMLRCTRRESAPDGRAEEQRTDYVRAAALMLFRARLTVLVAADR